MPEAMEIKACPFCGGPAWLAGDLRTEMWVECETCQACGPLKGDPTDIDIENAILNWNQLSEYAAKARAKKRRISEIIDNDAQLLLWQVQALEASKV